MADVDLSDLVGEPPKTRRAPTPLTNAKFSDVMDRVFGKGAWKQTGGFRSPKREDALRRSGAGTVPPGELSMHSLGSEDAPYARDVVVNGLTPQQTADRLKRAGYRFEKFIPEGQHGTQGGHLHINSELEEDVSGAPPQPAAATQAQPPRAPDVDLSDLADKAPKKGRGLDVGRELTAGFREVGRQTTEARQQFGREVQQQFRPRTEQEAERATVMGGFPGGAAVDQAALNLVGAPVSAVAKTLAQPISNALNAIPTPFGLNVPRADPQQIGDIASMVLPGLGEMRGEQAIGREASRLGVSRNALAANREARAAVPVERRPPPFRPQTQEQQAHNQDIALLHNNGITLSPRQIRGPHAGDAGPADYPTLVREQKGVEDYNRRIFEGTAKLGGMEYKPTAPLGKDGYQQLRGMYDQAYKGLRDRMKGAPDPQLTADIAEATRNLQPRERSSVRRLLVERVTPLFKKGSFTGDEYLALQEQLGDERDEFLRGNKYERDAGKALNGVIEALQSNIERHSAAPIRGDLQKLNHGYASLMDLEDAVLSGERTNGRFTPNQYLAAQRKGGPRQRTRAAAGKTDFADLSRAASNVLPKTISSLDRERGEWRRRSIGAALGATLGGAAGHMSGLPAGGEIGGGIGASAGIATVEPVHNALARALIESRTKRELAKMGLRPNERNVLRHLDRANRARLVRQVPLLAAPNALNRPQQ